MRLETARLHLREFVPDDWAAMHAYWRQPLYQRYNPEWADPAAKVRELVAAFVAAQAERPRRAWQLAIEPAAGGGLIGNCGLRVNDPARREGNLGYELSPAEWGKGYATEAARALLGFGFGTLGLHRVWAECVADNLGSARVLEKLGLRREARFREHQWHRDRWWDTLVYAVLDHEWKP
jgi:RimJ/RimL family protein N-acetyltransferase